MHFNVTNTLVTRVNGGVFHSLSPLKIYDLDE